MVEATPGHPQTGSSKGVGNPAQNAFWEPHPTRQFSTMFALAKPSAAAFDAAAVNWERELKSLTGGTYELEARRHLATTRYRAWEMGPTSQRARAATEALTAYGSRAPAGPAGRSA